MLNTISLPLKATLYKTETKDDFKIIYSLDIGDILIEQANGADKEHYCFNSWLNTKMLDNTTVAVFRITKLK